MEKLTLNDRMRSFSNYHWFFLKHHSRSACITIAIDMVLVLVSIIGVIRLPMASLAVFILSLGHLSYEIWKYQKDLRKFAFRNQTEITKTNRFKRDGKRSTIETIQPSQRQEQLKYDIRLLGKDPILSSDLINNSLKNCDWKIELDSMHPRLVRNNIIKHRDFCLQFLTKHYKDSFGRKIFTNDKKLCLSSEVDPDLENVYCHAGGYFSSFCTNEACTSIIQDKRGYENTGFSIFPVHYRKDDNTAKLDDLNVSAVNNHIGISTLAVTSDRYIVIWQQGQLNMQDPGKVVATASGSSDFSDLHPASLRETVIFGMQRELREEGLRHTIKLSYSEIAETAVIGFFRWLGRGGKPEFVGITRLNVPVSFVVPDHREVDEVRAKKAGRKMENCFFLQSVKEIPQVLEDVRNYEKKGMASLSIPLKVIFSRLEELSQKDEECLNNILYGP